MRFRIRSWRIPSLLKRSQSSSPRAGRTTLEDPNRDYDSQCRINHMRYHLDKVQVLAIVEKKDAETWLNQFGSPA